LPNSVRQPVDMTPRGLTINQAIILIGYGFEDWFGPI
jgi:hypothetical protein